MEKGWSHLDRKKQSGDLAPVIHHPHRGGEKVKPDSTWKHIATGTSCSKGLEEVKNVHHGDDEVLELVPVEAVGSLLWEALIALQISPATSRGWTDTLDPSA